MTANIMTNKYKNQYQSLPSNIPKTISNIDLVSDLQLTLNNLFTQMLNKDQKFTMRWIMGLEKYTHALTQPNTRTRYYRRGEIIMIELFGHFNTEITFLRPALVLYSIGERLLIAPISKSKYGDKFSLHIDLDIFEGMTSNSAILLDEIYMVDKQRVNFNRKDKNGNKISVSDEILTSVDNAILSNYLAAFNSKNTKLIESIQADNDTLRARINTLVKENEELALELTKLKENEVSI